MTSIAASSTASVAPSSAGRLFSAAFIGGGIAAAANLVLYFATHAAGVEFTGRFDPNQPATGLMVPMVAVASILPALFAGLLALGLSKWTRSPALIFGVIAAVFALLSIGGPMGVAEASMGTKVVLSIMHLVAAAGIGGMLVRALGFARS